MKQIIHFFRVHAGTDAVYQALTTERGLAGWWSTKLRIPRAAVGEIIDWTFLEGFNPDMEITALDPGRRVGWKCVGGHDNWQDNTFEFELTRRDDGATDVMFRQHYARELSDETYGEYNFNWAYYLSSLKQLCETGHGTPYDAG